MYITGLPSADLLTQSTTLENSGLDKDAFLKLLTVQLQYQDPSNPLDTIQMAEQMTNYAVLEQLYAINTSLSVFFDTEVQFQAVNMLGKELTLTDSEGNTVQGVVQSLRFSSEGPMVKVNGVEYSLSQVQEIKNNEGQE